MGNKINAIIVDDEGNSRKVLANLLNKFCPEIELCGEAEDVEEAYSLIADKKPELVFLDIQMPNGNGFTLLKKYTELPFEVIFVTSFDKYAINAIRFSALDYLLKPVEVKELVEAVQKAEKKIASKNNNDKQIINLLNNMESGAIEKSIAVHLNDKVAFVSVASVAYIEADDRYCHITTATGEKYIITKLLKEFEEFLSDNNAFIRISKNCMLNVNFIKNYSKGEPCMVDMKDGRTFEISRRKKQEVLERIKK